MMEARPQWQAAEESAIRSHMDVGERSPPQHDDEEYASTSTEGASGSRDIWFADTVVRRRPATACEYQPTSSVEPPVPVLNGRRLLFNRHC